MQPEEWEESMTKEMWSSNVSLQIMEGNGQEAEKI